MIRATIYLHRTLTWWNSAHLARFHFSGDCMILIDLVSRWLNKESNPNYVPNVFAAMMDSCCIHIRGCVEYFSTTEKFCDPELQNALTILFYNISILSRMLKQLELDVDLQELMQVACEVRDVASDLSQHKDLTKKLYDVAMTTTELCFEQTRYPKV